MLNPQINSVYYHRKYGVCKIVDIKSMTVNKSTKEYYVLEVIYDNELHVTLPVDYFKKAVRNLLSKEEILAILDEVNKEEVEVEKKTNARYTTLKDLVSQGDFYSSAMVMKNIIEHKESHRISHNDQKLMESLDKFVFGEMAYVLGMSFAEAKEYFLKKVIEE